MHALTKVLVVLASVLAMVLAGLTIGYVANTSGVDQAYKALEAQNAALRSSELAAQALADDAAERIADLSAALESEISDRETRIAELERENDGLQQEVATLRLAEERYASRIDQFTATLETYASLSEARAAELQDLRIKEVDAAKREIDMIDRLNDVQGQLEVASESNRALQEQLARLRDEVANASRGGATASASGNTIPGPDALAARVVEVTTDVNGQPLVSINAGSSDGLRERMRLIVFRDNRFLANLVVESVNINDAVGRIDTLGRSVDILPGDRVLSSRG